MKILTTIIIVAVIVVGIILLFNREPVEAPTTEVPTVETQTETPTGLVPSQSTIHTIRYTNAGYSPSPLTIRAGDMVVFKNESSREMWTASAVHPTHKAYPGSGLEKCGTPEAASIFDACADIAPGLPAGQAGGEWSFIFNEPGTWAYHNHRQANHTGRVVVE